jgi:hypothetical protein
MATVYLASDLKHEATGLELLPGLCALLRNAGTHHPVEVAG